MLNNVVQTLPPKRTRRDYLGTGNLGPTSVQEHRSLFNVLVIYKVFISNMPSAHLPNMANDVPVLVNKKKFSLLRRSTTCSTSKYKYYTAVVQLYEYVPMLANNIMLNESNGGFTKKTLKENLKNE